VVSVADGSLKKKRNKRYPRHLATTGERKKRFFFLWGETRKKRKRGRLTRSDTAEKKKRRTFSLKGGGKGGKKVGGSSAEPQAILRGGSRLHCAKKPGTFFSSPWKRKKRDEGVKKNSFNTQRIAQERSKGRKHFLFDADLPGGRSLTP